MLLDELAAQKKGKRSKKRDVVRFLMEDSDFFVPRCNFNIR